MTLDDAGRGKSHTREREVIGSSDASSLVLLGVVWVVFVVVLLSLGVAWQVAGVIDWVAVESILFLAWLPVTLVGALLLDGRYS